MVLSVIFVWWLIRIATLDRFKKVPPELSGACYNILMPIKTYRGILQALFIPWRNPAYETRILIGHGNMTAVINGKFRTMKYDRNHIRVLIRNGGIIKPCKNYSKEKVQELEGKSLILGFRDCKKLEL